MNAFRKSYVRAAVWKVCDTNISVSSWNWKAEKEKLAKALSTEKDVQQNKMVMSRADLMHLLEDSIEKTMTERKDLDIKDRCSKTKMFI